MVLFRRKFLILNVKFGGGFEREFKSKTEKKRDFIWLKSMAAYRLDFCKFNSRLCQRQCRFNERFGI